MSIVSSFTSVLHRRISTTQQLHSCWRRLWLMYICLHCTSCLIRFTLWRSSGRMCLCWRTLTVSLHHLPAWVRSSRYLLSVLSVSLTCCRMLSLWRSSVVLRVVSMLTTWLIPRLTGWSSVISSLSHWAWCVRSTPHRSSTTTTSPLRSTR